MPYKWPPNILYLRSILLKTLVGNSVGEIYGVVKCLGLNLSFLC